MATRCPGSRMLGLAGKRGWRFIINERGYVTALDDSSAETLGCLWELTDEHREELDRYEGVASGFYRVVKCEVYLLDSLETVQAFAYKAAHEISGIPSESYANAVFAGAREIGLPEKYVTAIEAWRNGPPVS